MPRYARHIAAPPRHGRAPPPPPLVAPNLYHGVPPAPPAADPLLPLPSSTEWRIFGLGVLIACLICWIILPAVLRWFRRTVADAVADGIAKAWRERTGSVSAERRGTPTTARGSPERAPSCASAGRPETPTTPTAASRSAEQAPTTTALPSEGRALWRAASPGIAADGSGPGARGSADGLMRYCSNQNKFSTKTASSYGYGDQSYVALWWIVEIVWCCSLVSPSICFGEGISRTSRYMI